MIKFLRRFKPFKSIQFYIILMVVLSGMIPAFFLTATMMNNYEEETVEADTATIVNQANILAAQISKESYISSLGSIRLEEQMELISAYNETRIMIVNSAYEVIYDTYEFDLGKTVISEAVFNALDGKTYRNYDSENEYIGVVVPITNSKNGEINGALAVSVSTTDLTDTLRHMWTTAVMMVSAILILVILFAVFGTKKLMKPFEKMSDSIDQMEMDFANDQLNVLDYAETREVSEAFNKMLSRMKTVDDSRKDFVANVSHELKTPLASVKVLADSLVAQEDVPLEVYRDFMTDITQEIDRENNIINDLLALVKNDQGQAALDIKSVNVNEVVEQTMKRLKPIIDLHNIELIYEKLKPITAEIDETKMTRVFTNLIENAVKYNRDSGWIRVTLNSDQQYFYFKVEDSGIGIPKESLDHVFERFYRVDKSHSREIGGTGLGLAIVRSTVLLHRGAIRVDSTEGKGSTFTMRIPLVHEETE
jgi:signal transduction histidine kinase